MEKLLLKSYADEDGVNQIDNYVFKKNNVGIAGVFTFLDIEKDFVNTVLKMQEKHFDNIKACIFSTIVYKYRESQWVYDYCKSIGIDDYVINQTSTGVVYGVFVVPDYGIFIAFKGSSSFNDFLADINIDLVETKDFPGQIHEGFAKLLLDEDCYYKIFNVFNDFLKKNEWCKNVYITGHSLGGALSTLFYSLCSSKNLILDKNVTHISFGAPRIGNSVFASSIKTKRIVNKVDIIPMIPLPFRYRHTDYKEHCGKKELCKLFSIGDHYIEDYYYSIKSML